MAQYNRPPLQNLYGARIDRSSRQEKRENRKNNARVQAIIESVEEESITRRAQSLPNFNALELRAVADYLQQPNAVAYLDGRQVTLEQAHNLPRDGHWHHVSIVRNTGRMPTATERWECVDPDGTIYRELQRTNQGFGAAGAMERYALMPNPSDFRPRFVTPPAGPVLGNDIYQAMAMAVHSSMLGVDLAREMDMTALQVLQREQRIDTERRRTHTGRMMQNYPIQSIGAGFLHMGVAAEELAGTMRSLSDTFSVSFAAMRSGQEYPNAQQVAKGEAVIPPHPDAGKVIRRPLRSLAGIMVEDVRQADGSVARRVRKDDGK